MHTYANPLVVVSMLLLNLPSPFSPGFSASLSHHDGILGAIFGSFRCPWGIFFGVGWPLSNTNCDSILVPYLPASTLSTYHSTSLLHATWWLSASEGFEVDTSRRTSLRYHQL